MTFSIHSLFFFHFCEFYLQLSKSFSDIYWLNFFKMRFSQIRSFFLLISILFVTSNSEEPLKPLTTLQFRNIQKRFKEPDQCKILFNLADQNGVRQPKIIPKSLINTNVKHWFRIDNYSFRRMHAVETCTKHACLQLHAAVLHAFGEWFLAAECHSLLWYYHKLS